MLSFAEYVQQAVAARASDIHVCTGYPLSMRVDGSVRGLTEEILTAEQADALAREILNPVREETLRTKGEVDFAHTCGGARMRCNVYLECGNTAMAIRLLSDKVPRFETLGLPPGLLDMCDKKRGLVLVTGITGSGKSTTLASIVNAINERHDYHILTIEEPVEYIYPKGRSVINQREIGSDSQTFATALRAALRQDPDCILLGEMRDVETISTAITAAETGHLVLSTLHTVSAASAVDRIIDTFTPHQQQQVRAQLADALECVVSQQLIPRADGSGRVVACEVMGCNNAIRSLIREGKTYQIPNSMLSGKKQGMQLMDDAIYELYIRGKISSENAIKYAQDREAMGRKVII